MNRILASRFSFGQGRDFTKECGGIEAGGHDRCQGQFTGQLQPYSVYVPKKPPPARGYGLTLLLHALSANHNQYLGSRHAEQMGERGAGSIVITPGGRGPDGFYYDVAEADVFETWADIARVYDLDPDWTAISGYSMGGIGTFRLGGRWPDLFARAAPIVATATTADNTRWLPSFRNLPMIWWVATLDELQNIAWTEETFGHLRDLGYRFSQYRFETWDHLTPATNDWYPQIAEYLGEHRVDRDPPQVTYAVSRGPDNPERGVVADHAYWLSGVRQRGDGTGVVDLRSEAFGVTAPVPTGIAQSAGVHSGGHHEPAPFTLREQAWETKAAPPADRLSGTATNIATVTVDVARARLSCAPAIDVRSDGPIDVRIACPPPPRSARRRACTARMTIRLPRVKGRRITRAVVRRGRRTVARRSGRNLRSIRIRRVTRRAHTLRVELRTANGRTRRVVLTRRVAACR